MKKLAVFLALFVAFAVFGSGSSSAARLVARIDLSQQRMYVYVGGRRYYSWPVSTGRRGYGTPTGNYVPKRLVRMHYSKKYYNSPMPHSVFFRGGFAVHGTGAIRKLGRRASHGCVRLHPAHAARLYRLIKQVGRANSRIQIVR